VQPTWGRSGDYHLQAGSPAIDAGTQAGAPTTDLDGVPRDTHPTWGAYEWRPTPPPTPGPRIRRRLHPATGPPPEPAPHPLDELPRPAWFVASSPVPASGSWW